MIHIKYVKTGLCICALTLFSSFLIGNNIQFGKKSDLTDWYVINDGVMGGRSKGQCLYTDSSVVFWGDISFANNGGFSALKSPFRNFDLSGFKNLTVHYKSSDQAMALTFEMEKQFYKPYYKYVLESTQGQWQVKTIKLQDFDEVRLSQKTGSKLLKSQLPSIIRLGLINTDKIEGPFKIEIASIHFE
jgi:hypothetical protein